MLLILTLCSDHGTMTCGCAFTHSWPAALAYHRQEVHCCWRALGAYSQGMHRCVIHTSFLLLSRLPPALAVSALLTLALLTGAAGAAVAAGEGVLASGGHCSSAAQQGQHEAR